MAVAKKASAKKAAAKKAPANKKAAAKKASAAGKVQFSAEERAAMKEHAEDLKRAAKRGGKADKAADEQVVLDKIAAMASADREIAQRIHQLVKDTAPGLDSRTWYGMPAYTKDGKVVCFFQSAGKFKSRYATLGFTDTAALDDGDMWPTYFAITKLTPAVEKQIVALVKQAAG